MKPGVGDQLNDQLQEVMKINERHWAQRNRRISAETVRKHLHIGAAQARKLTSTVRALDRATIERELVVIKDGGKAPHLLQGCFPPV